MNFAPSFGFFVNLSGILLSFSSPNPNWPYLFQPNEYTSFLLSSNNEWLLPHAIFMIFAPSSGFFVNISGNILLFLSPNPNCPCLFQPNEYTSFLLSSNNVWLPPHAIFINFAPSSGFFVNLSIELLSFLSPNPNWP